MKPYGNSRAQNLTCRYGCCTHGTVKTGHRGVAPANIRRGRKAARRSDKRLIREAE